VDTHGEHEPITGTRDGVLGGVQEQGPCSGVAKPPDEVENLSPVRCPTEAENSPHYPYSANWQLKHRT